jgi:RNA polymerase sigma-70 factor, ECF subfamily
MDTRDTWIAEVYESNSTTVYRVCQRLLKNTEDAADATQEVFVRALVSWTAETSSERARAWLITVARHHCLDLLRRKKRMGKALTTLAAEPLRQGDAERAVVDRSFVQAVLSQLRTRERQALWQSAVEYRPIGEIGSYLGLSYEAAAQLLHRARRHASLVAAKLAAIFGLLQLSRLGKRPAFGVEFQPLTVAFVMPRVVAGLVGASSSNPSSVRPFAGPGGVTVGSPARAAAGTTSSAAPVSAGEAPGRLGLPAATMPALLHQARSTINGLITGVLPAPSKLLPTAVPLPTPSGLIPRPPSITAADSALAPS